MSSEPSRRSVVADRSRVDRRAFLGRLAGGAAVAAGFQRAEAAETSPAARPSVASRPSLARGRVIDVRGEIREYKDAKTGARVRRLTGGGSNNVHPYFTSWAFVGDDATRTVFVSDRSGRPQWHMLDIAAGKLVQLTDCGGVSPNMACLARGGLLFYFDGGVLRAVDVDSLEDRELYRVPSGYKASLPTCTADGRYVAFAYCEETALSTETGRIYATMHERYYQRPNSVVMRIKAENGEAVAAWGEPTWISHVLIHPTMPDTIVFCHEGGSTCVDQRMWIVDVTYRRLRRATPLYPQREGEMCVHEFFTQQGDVGFQYSLDRDGQREEYNAFIRPDGTWIRQYLLPGGRPGHIQANSDNTLLVGDCGYLSADDEEGRNYISLMTHVNGRVQVRRLAWHGTSGKTQASHGHPSFSGDDRWVVYNSDAEKSDNVYMADVESLS